MTKDDVGGRGQKFVLKITSFLDGPLLFKLIFSVTYKLQEIPLCCFPCHTKQKLITAEVLIGITYLLLYICVSKHTVQLSLTTGDAKSSEI